MSSLNLGHAGLLPRSPYPRHPKYSMAYLLDTTIENVQLLRSLVFLIQIGGNVPTR